MKRGAIIALSILGVLLLAVLGVGAWLLTPGRAATYEEPVPLEQRMSNTDAAGGLARLGIDEYAVDTDDERILLIYDLPVDYAGDAQREEVVQRMVLAVGAAAAPQVDKVVAVQMANGTVLRTWTMQMSDFDAYAAGEIDAATLDARVVRE